MSGSSSPEGGSRPGLKTRRFPLGTHAVLALLLIVAVAPILLMWVTAFKSSAELAANPFGLPEVWRFENFVQTWEEGRFGTYVRSSVIVVIPVVAVAIVFSVLAGYAFGAFRFRGQQALFLLLLMGVMIPTEGIIIPLYYVMDDYGLLNTYWALILPQIAVSTSFGAFWMRAFFADLPRDLTDAAAVDGAGPLRALWYVLLPLALPALGTLAVLLFMWTWNEFLLALVLVQDEAVRTLPVGLSFFQGQYTAQVPLLAAAATMVSLPVLLLYAVLHRRFIAGMASGAIKG